MNRDQIEDNHGAVARMVRAALKTRDHLLEVAEAQPFDDEVFHAAQQAACGWQIFAEALIGSGDAEAIRLVRQ